MESQDIIKQYPWYIPARVALWMQSDGQGVDAATEMIVMNHPEAVVQHEDVDMDFLVSLADDVTPKKRQLPVSDAVSSLQSMGLQSVERSESSDLIDKFLELKDFKITPFEEKAGEVQDLMWHEVVSDQPFTAEDDLASEELADIYLKQGLYEEASDIYNRLFLLYSEKSVYFATQIENVAKIVKKS